MKPKGNSLADELPDVPAHLKRSESAAELTNGNWVSPAEARAAGYSDAPPPAGVSAAEARAAGYTDAPPPARVSAAEARAAGYTDAPPPAGVSAAEARAAGYTDAPPPAGVSAAEARAAGYSNGPAERVDGPKNIKKSAGSGGAGNAALLGGVTGLAVYSTIGGLDGEEGGEADGETEPAVDPAAADQGR